MQHYSGFGLLKHSLSHHENWQSVWRNPTPKKKYDVIIIGGGGHGLARSCKVLVSMGRLFTLAAKHQDLAPTDGSHNN